MGKLRSTVGARKSEHRARENAGPDERGEGDVQTIEERAIVERSSCSDGDLRREDKHGDGCTPTDCRLHSPTPGRGHQCVNDKDPDQERGASVQHRVGVGAAEIWGEPSTAQRPRLTGPIGVLATTVDPVSSSKYVSPVTTTMSRRKTRSVTPRD